MSNNRTTGIGVSISSASQLVTATYVHNPYAISAIDNSQNETLINPEGQSISETISEQFPSSQTNQTLQAPRQGNPFCPANSAPQTTHGSAFTTPETSTNPARLIHNPYSFSGMIPYTRGNSPPTPPPTSPRQPPQSTFPQNAATTLEPTLNPASSQRRPPPTVTSSGAFPSILPSAAQSTSFTHAGNTGPVAHNPHAFVSMAAEFSSRQPVTQIPTVSRVFQGDMPTLQPTTIQSPSGLCTTINQALPNASTSSNGPYLFNPSGFYGSSVSLLPVLTTTPPRVDIEMLAREKFSRFLETIDKQEKASLGRMIKDKLREQISSGSRGYSSENIHSLINISNFFTVNPDSLKFPDDDLNKLEALLSDILGYLKGLTYTDLDEKCLVEKNIRRINTFQSSVNTYVKSLKENHDRLAVVLNKLANSIVINDIASYDNIGMEIFYLFSIYKSQHVPKEEQKDIINYRQRYNYYELFLTLIESFANIASAEKPTGDLLMSYMKQLTQILFGSYLEYLDNCLSFLAVKIKLSSSLLFAYKHLLLNYAIKILAPYIPLSTESQLPPWSDILEQLSTEEQSLLKMVEHILNKTSFFPTNGNPAYVKQYIRENVISVIQQLLAVISPPQHYHQSPIA